MTRNDELADLALKWLTLSKKDRQYAVILLLDRGLAEFDRNLNLQLVRNTSNRPDQSQDQLTDNA